VKEDLTQNCASYSLLLVSIKFMNVELLLVSIKFMNVELRSFHTTPFTSTIKGHSFYCTIFVPAYTAHRKMFEINVTALEKITVLSIAMFCFE
jgi:hypothetical protein